VVASPARLTVPVPTYDQFIEPILRYLAARTDGALARDVHDAAVDALALSDADRPEPLPDPLVEELATSNMSVRLRPEPGQRANKGVFLTTSSFTSQATEFATSVERVVLIDGTRLAELMIDHEVGVQLRAGRVPKLDSDYFES
jgi:restriction endonuclease Mrr